MRKRQRALEKLRPSSETKKTSSKDKDEFTQGTAQQRKKIKLNDNSENKSPSRQETGSLKTVGQMMEIYDVQFVTLVLIFLDLVALSLSLALNRMSPSCTSEKTNSEEDRNIPYTGILWLLNAFTDFTLIFFMVELAVLMFAFKAQFFFHIGYVLDSLIITICVIAQIHGILLNKEMRLLSFFRVWRLVRYMNTTLDQVKKSHDKTKELLSDERSNRLNTEKELARMKELQVLELESKEQIEHMLMGYKDEVETLSEALNIAALDVATGNDSSDNNINVEEQGRKEISTTYIDADGDAFYDE